MRRAVIGNTRSDAYDAASDTFTPATEADQPPQGHNAKCGFACHTIVRRKGLRFHGVPEEVNGEHRLSSLPFVLTMLLHHRRRTRH